jgi:hypothetical protein
MIQLWIIAIARNASQQAARRSHGIVNLMQKLHACTVRENYVWFYALHEPFCIFTAHTPSHCPRERRLVAIFNKLTMPPRGLVNGQRLTG